MQEPPRRATMATMSDVPAPAPTARPAKRRPFTLYVLVGLMVLKSILVMLLVRGSLFLEDASINSALRMPNVAQFVRVTPAISVLLIVLAATLIVSAVLLLAGRRLGWLIAMVLTGVSVAVDIVTFVAGSGSELWMFLNVVTVFYLNQRDIRELVGATLEPVVELPEAVPS
jgi:hypothetical protein